MGNCSSDTTDGGLIPHRDTEQAQPPQIQVTDSAMGDRSDYNNFLEANNCMLKMAKDTYEQYDDLKRQYRDLKRKNEEIMAQYETLRQRFVEYFFKVTKTPDLERLDCEIRRGRERLGYSRIHLCR